jgi:hypothetical protein
MWPSRAPGWAIKRLSDMDTGAERALQERSGKKAMKINAPQKMRCAFIPTMTACRCCGGEFRKTRRWQKCCSRECQLIYLAAQTFIKAYRAGRAEGLRHVIRELRERSR